MVGRYVSELVEGARVDAAFVVRTRELRVTRAGEAFLSLELGDRSGSIPAVLFRPDSRACDIPSGSVVRVSGTVTRFRGIRRISMDSLIPADTWDPADLLGCSRRPKEELVAELKDIVRTVKSASLRRLLAVVFGDKDFFERFCASPASQGAHHPYMSGLLEHTVAVAATCLATADRYPEVDRDLLLTAALIHDAGIVDQLSPDALSVSDGGRLLGTEVLGLLRLHRAATRAKLSERTLLALEHALLCARSDGVNAPKTLEAVLLGHADALDIAVAGYARSAEAAALVEEEWTRNGCAVAYGSSAA